MKKATKRFGSPEAITTDGLRSYKAAMNELGNVARQEIGRWANNRGENSHLPFRRRERAMLRFRQIKTLQKFASVHAEPTLPSFISIPSHLSNLMNIWGPIAPSQERPPIVLWWALLLVSAYPSFEFGLMDFTHRDGLFLPHALTWWGRDFTNLYFGGRFAIVDKMNVYDQAAYLPALRQQSILAGQNYSYPPVTLAIGYALSLLPYVVALLLWSVGGLACFVIAARRFIDFKWPWLLLLPPVAAFPHGQWGLFAAALWLWSFAGSGFAAGLLTMKPHLGLLLAPTLALKRQWHQIAVAMGVTLLLWLLADWALGLTRAFFTAGASTQMTILTTKSDEPFFRAMPSTYVLLRHFPFAWLAHGLVAATSVAMLWGLRHQPPLRLAFPLATASFLVLPYGFSYDMAVVSLGFLTLLHARWADLTWAKRIMTVGGYLSVVVPQAAPGLLLAGLWVQRDFLRSLPVPAAD